MVVAVVSAAAATDWEAAGSVEVVDLDWEAREGTGWGEAAKVAAGREATAVHRAAAAVAVGQRIV